mgnify:CR=1 FL=1|tara:strand:- start:257 stop:514 length:258 start_codon:yes stop_codon:yes gene_type:complete
MSINRFSIPDLERDVKRYIKKKEKWEKLVKKKQGVLGNFVDDKKLERRYNEYIQSMKLLEYKYTCNQIELLHIDNDATAPPLEKI